METRVPAHAQERAGLGCRAGSRRGWTRKHRKDGRKGHWPEGSRQGLSGPDYNIIGFSQSVRWTGLADGRGKVWLRSPELPKCLEPSSER